MRRAPPVTRTDLPLRLCICIKGRALAISVGIEAGWPSCLDLLADRRACPLNLDSFSERRPCPGPQFRGDFCRWSIALDRKRRLNSSHLGISYAVFCLKKK